MNGSDSRDNSSKEKLWPHTTWQNSLEHFVRSRKSVTRSCDQSASVVVICVVKCLLQRSALTLVFSLKVKGRQKERVTEKGGGKRIRRVRCEKKQKVTKTERRVCHSLTRHRSAWWSCNSVMVNCSAPCYSKEGWPIDWIFTMYLEVF